MNGRSDLSQGNHTFWVRALDKAGKVDASPASRSWFVDTVVPTGRISINGGASSTSSRSVTLSLSASDPSPASGVAYMRFRNGGLDFRELGVQVVRLIPLGVPQPRWKRPFRTLLLPYCCQKPTVR
jgi:hypothetical protein